MAVKKEFTLKVVSRKKLYLDVQVHKRQNVSFCQTGPVNKQVELSDSILSIPYSEPLITTEISLTTLSTEHRFYEEVLMLQMQLFIFEMWHTFANEYELRKRTLEVGRFTSDLYNWHRSTV